MAGRLFVPACFAHFVEILNVEFITFDEATEALREVGIEGRIEEELLLLDADSEFHSEAVCHLHLTDGTSEASPREGANSITVKREQIADAIDGMVGQLHLSQLLLLPKGKWRSVFDAVAFSMAADEDWQGIDAMATVKLNTRDPLICDPGDYQLLHSLINALLSDAESPEQGIIVTSTATPFIAEVIPDGAVRVMVGNQVLADEIRDALAG